MTKILGLLSVLFLLISCDTSTTIRDHQNELHLIPYPKEINLSNQILLLSSASQLYSADPALLSLAELFAGDLERLCGFRPTIADKCSKQTDVIFSLDTLMNSDCYEIEMAKEISVRGGSYAALAMARSTLLQLLVVEDGLPGFQVVQLKDYPDAGYRGLLIDLARQWHSLETVKKLIDLAAFYKINFVQLHFTDYQSYTLPSTAFPKLPTEGRHYSYEDLSELESYSQQRGVTIVPELEVPGHAMQFVRKYPEIFGIKDSLSNPWIINMGKEEVYSALDLLIGELTEVFKATPYFHIGGDEAIFDWVDQDPDVQAYCGSHGIASDVHELYRHFLVRMNETVKKHGKQMCVWEGFGPTGVIPIPKDLVVFEFETNRYLPDQLVADGYTVVNASWKPLYVVNQKKWSPETIYGWNLWRWENWWESAPSFDPIQVEKSPLIIGAEMCSWEQPEETEIPSLRKRLPAFVERIWNTEQKMDFWAFKKQLEQIDPTMSLILGDSRQDSLGYEYDFIK